MFSKAALIDEARSVTFSERSGLLPEHADISHPPRLGNGWRLDDNCVTHWARRTIYNANNPPHGRALTMLLFLCIFFATAISRFASYTQLAVFDANLVEDVAFGIRTATWLLMASQWGQFVGGIFSNDILAKISDASLDSALQTLVLTAGGSMTGLFISASPNVVYYFLLLPMVEGAIVVGHLLVP